SKVLIFVVYHNVSATNATNTLSLHDALPIYYDMFGEDIDTNDQDLLNAYAKNIYNYAYNYKPEARNVDPSIDPSQEHIGPMAQEDRKSTRLNSSHVKISYAVFCWNKKNYHLV